MRIGFAGTPAFAAVALQAILDAGWPVALVLTRPDRPHGRGMKSDPGPVKALAAVHRIPVLQPARLGEAGVRAPIVVHAIDVLVVAAYGLLLPPAVLDWPRHGCINIHASLLPRWRGAAPIQRALLAGDQETGISIMRIDTGLDTGPVIARHPLTIAARETAGSLHDRLSELGARAIVAALQQLQREGHLTAQAQSEAGATYAAKVERSEAVIDWHQSAHAIDRRIRAFNPAPGAQTAFAGETVKLWEAHPAGGSGAPGAVLRADSAGILVACGEGALNLTSVQRAGGRRLSAAAFLAGHPLPAETRLGRASG